MPDVSAELTIHIDGQPYRTSSPTMSGAQLKALAHKDAVYQVFMEGAANEPDRLIADHEAIVLRPGQQFYTIPPAMAGRSWISLKSSFERCVRVTPRPVSSGGGTARPW
jgi:hypothetical protein